MIRSNAGFTISPSPREWAPSGGIWGLLWGIAPGIVLGWGGGPTGFGLDEIPPLGLLSWIAISVAFLAR